MSLEILWAGWRNAYVQSHADVEGTPGGSPDPASTPDPDPGDDPAACVFCRLAASGPPSAGNGVLWADEVVFCVLNAYPYAPGHFMVLPRRHVGTLGGLSEEEGLGMWRGLRAGVAALEAAYRPDGINIGANLGRAAGAGIPRHVHLHALPRWSGDTNFMTSVASARVMPEDLVTSWERLVAAWPA